MLMSTANKITDAAKKYGLGSERARVVMMLTMS